MCSAETFGTFVLYKNVQTYYYSGGMAHVNKRAVGALVVAELISTLGSRMTYLALPWFVLVTTGSAAKMSVVLAVQILPMAILGVPSGSLVQKLGSRTAMLMADFARAPLIMALPLLHAAGICLLACCSRSLPPSGRSCRRTRRRSA